MEELTNRKHAELGGIWANSNMDGDEKDQQRKENILRDLDSNYDAAFRSLLSRGRKEVKDPDPFEMDPLFAAIPKSDGSQRMSSEDREALQREFLLREEKARMMEDRK